MVSYGITYALLLGAAERRHLAAELAVRRAVLHSGGVLFELLPRSRAPRPPRPGGRLTGRRQSGGGEARAAGANRISIFLNIFDVHVNRTPIGGEDRRASLIRRASFWWRARKKPASANEQNVDHRGRRGRRARAPRGLQADRRADRAPHHLLQDAGRHVASRRARRTDQVRLARGCIAGARMGGDGEGRASASRPARA